MNTRDILYDYNLPPDSSMDMKDILQKGSKDIYQFSYDKLKESVPLFSLFSEYECSALYKIATSIKYAGNKQKKLQEISNIMRPRGFFRLAGGTNRVVYYNPDIPDLVWKIATDDTGLRDNPAEMYNQKFIKPYCTKVFTCHPSGIIASFERVQRITNYYEFEEMRHSVFDIITKKLIGKYVLEDFGIDYFMNWGFRKNFGPVILDFPYVYEVIGEKLRCGAILENGCMCGGEIDYTPDFNKLVCTKCGTEYRARELGKSLKDSNSSLERKGKNMKIVITRGNEVIKTSYQKDTVDYLGRPAKAKSWKHRTKSNEPIQEAKYISKTPAISISRGRKSLDIVDDTPTVARDIEKKRDITANIERSYSQSRDIEIETKNENRNSNIPEGYVRDIKMGRVVGYKSLDGKEYISVDDYEKIKTAKSNDVVINKDLIEAQKRRDVQIQKQNESGTNKDIIDKIVGNNKPHEIVTDTETLRQAPIVSSNDSNKEDVKESTNIDTSTVEIATTETEALYAPIEENAVTEKDIVSEHEKIQNDESDVESVTEQEVMQTGVTNENDREVKSEALDIDTSLLVGNMMRNTIPDDSEIHIPESLKEDVEEANRILLNNLQNAEDADEPASVETQPEQEEKRGEELKTNVTASQHPAPPVWNPKLNPSRSRGKRSLMDVLDNY